MKYLILENDNRLQENFEAYISEKIIAVGDVRLEKIFNVANTKMEVLVSAFSNSNILLFDPTMITYSQYNSFMMLMYSLIKKGTLGIKEIHIFHHDEQELVNDLQDLWAEDREYLDHVIKVVKVFMVDGHDKKQIFI